jgi:RHS repeat-associated protein
VRKDGEYPLFDGLGSERTVTNAGQTVIGTISYDAFGQIVGTTGCSTNPYMFAATWGYRNDGDAGLMHVGARYYDAAVGRFITRDTVLSEHPYLYCEHEPVNWVDPSGYTRQTIQWYVNMVQALAKRDVDWIETLIDVAKPGLEEVRLPPDIRAVIEGAKLPPKISTSPGRVGEVRKLIDKLVEHMVKYKPGIEPSNYWIKEMYNYIKQIGDKLRLK